MKNAYSELRDIMAMLCCMHAEDLEANLEAFLNRWLMIVETVILRRRIVKKIKDLGQTSQVLLSLIKDDGSDLEDVW